MMSLANVALQHKCWQELLDRNLSQTKVQNGAGLLITLITRLFLPT